MTATEAPAPATFESFDPRTGDVVGTHPVRDAPAVHAANTLTTSMAFNELWTADSMVGVMGDPFLFIASTEFQSGE